MYCSVWVQFRVRWCCLLWDTAVRQRGEQLETEVLRLTER